jgi:sigma-B regulation protein RsbU (phosphoserine phosphatase)
MKELSESRVLIVDDDRSNVDILVEALRSDYKVSVALDAKSALWNIQMTAPDLVLLDIVMPGILFLSALEDVEAKVKGFQAGGNDYLTKPFEMLEVQARVRSLLKAKAYAEAVKERWASELRIAHEIQLRLLPANLNLIAKGSGLDIESLLQPAEGVGRDFYEVLRTTTGQVLFVIGEVSGKGIPGALLMAITSTVVRMIATQFQQPEVILRWVSDALAVHGTQGLTVTLLCGLYDPAAGRLTYSTAGHPPPAVRRDGHAILWTQEASEGVGSPRGLVLANSSFNLRPGDAVLLFTNGVLDAASPEGIAFGESRLIERLNRSQDQNSKDLVADVVKALQHHMKDQPQPDDIALLALRRLE